MKNGNGPLLYLIFMLSGCGLCFLLFWFCIRPGDPLQVPRGGPWVVDETGTQSRMMLQGLTQRSNDIYERYHVRVLVRMVPAYASEQAGGDHVNQILDQIRASVVWRRSGLNTPYACIICSLNQAAGLTSGTYAVYLSENASDVGLRSDTFAPRYPGAPINVILPEILDTADSTLTHTFSESTWQGRRLDRRVTLLCQQTWFWGYFASLFLIALRAFDGRPKQWFVVPLELAIILWLAIASLRAFMYYSGWPEGVAAIRGFWALSLITLFLPLVNTATRRQSLSGIVVSISLLLASSITLFWGSLSLAYPFPAAVQSALILVGSSLVWTTLLCLLFVPVRYVLNLTQDFSTGMLGPVLERGRRLDLALCFRVGKPAPNKDARGGLARARLLRPLAESALGYIYWGILLLASSRLGTSCRNRATRGHVSKLWGHVASMYCVQFNTIMTEYLPDAERLLESGYPARAKESAEKGVAVLSILESVFPPAGKSHMAYRLHYTLGIASMLIGEPEKSRKALARAGEIASAISPVLDLELLVKLGRLHYEYGDYDQAASMFGKALASVRRLEAECGTLGCALRIDQMLQLLRSKSVISPAPDSLGVLHDLLAVGVQINELDVIRSEVAYSYSMCLERQATTETGPQKIELEQRAASLRNDAFQPPYDYHFTTTPSTLSARLLKNWSAWIARKAIEGLVAGETLDPEQLAQVNNNSLFTVSEDGTITFDEGFEYATDRQRKEAHRQLVTCLGSLECADDESGIDQECVQVDSHAKEDAEDIIHVLASGSGWEAVVASWDLLQDMPLREDVWSELSRSANSGHWQFLLKGRGDPPGDPAKNALYQLASGDSQKALLDLYRWMARNEGMRVANTRPSDAERMFRFALYLCRLTENTGEAADVLLCLSELAANTNRPHSALALANIAGYIADETARRELEQRASLRQGIALHRLGRMQEAEEEFDWAINLLEETRSRFCDPDSRLLYMGLQVDAYSYQVEIALETQSSARALEYVERSKSRSLVELLSNATKIKVREAADRELLQEDERIQAEIFRLERDPGSGDQDRMRSLRNELSEVKKRIRANSAAWTGLRVVKPIPFDSPDDSDDLRRCIIRTIGNSAERFAVLEYLVMSERTHVFFVDSSKSGRMRVEHTSIPIGRRKLTELLHSQYNEEFGPNGGCSNARLEMLYTVLIRPVEELLRSSQSTALLISPHDVLHSVPFHSLVYRDRDGRQQFLIQDYPCAYMPSVTVLGSLRRRSGSIHDALVVGNPRRRGLDASDRSTDLPFAEREARQLAEFLGVEPVVREEATKHSVLSRLPHADVIHLACHSCFSSHDALQSHLELADGYLHVDEILDLELIADLATLSACSSGLSKVLRGDELIGMNRAWMYAGVNSLLTTHWNVEDDASATLCELFYHNWLKRGMSKIRALQQAQCEMISLGWERPYYWAAFALSGLPE